MSYYVRTSPESDFEIFDKAGLDLESYYVQLTLDFKAKYCFSIL